MESNFGLHGTLDVRRLRYFVAVAKYKNFTQAAQSLYMAQPPLSQQILRLEADLGLKLFSRSSRRVELTPDGEFFLQAAQQALLEFDYLERLAVRLRDGEAGHLRIGFAFSVLNWGLSAHLKAFRDRFPQVTLEVTQLPVADQIAALDTNLIDLGFTIGPINADNVDVCQLGIEDLCAVLPTGHHLAGDATVSLNALRLDDFVGFSAPDGYDYISHACHVAGFVPHLNLQGAQVHTMIHMVGAGLGVTLAPACDCRLPVDGVTFRPIDYPTPNVAISAVWRRDRDHNLVDKLISQINESGRTQGVRPRTTGSLSAM